MSGAELRLDAVVAQGGLLLAQAARDVQPLREALDAALTYVASYTVDGAH